ncbi:PAS domain-containing protein [Rhizobium leguminosarum]|uniref:PAS domain-containing protein n=1 Tax=Rhizobium leguminosarum TaxID=384 RepID=UPI0032AE9263
MILEDFYRLLKSGHVQAQAIVDTMTQPIVVLDHNFCIMSANNAFVRTFGTKLLRSRQRPMGNSRTSATNRVGDPKSRRRHRF